MKKSKPKPSPEEVAKSKEFVRQNWSLIALHSLYQRWGLPTKRLEKIFKNSLDKPKKI